MKDNAKNWDAAIKEMIEEQVEYGTFVDGRMLITSRDGEDAFCSLTVELNTDNLQELIINDDTGLQAITDAAIFPHKAADVMKRMRTAIGIKMLEMYRNEIETQHARRFS